MDPEISSWVIEWLLRNNAPETLVKQSLEILPISACGSRIKKLILLRTIEGEVSQGLVGETILKNLEMIEELNCFEGTSVSEVMREAYCAVALECTLKFLAASPHDNPEYIKAVDRIWRGRIRQMEASKVTLFSEELKDWKNDIEVSLGEPELRQRFSNMHSRRNALIKVRAYLEEARAEMGPSFLETVKADKAACGFVSEAQPLDKNEGRSDRQVLDRGVSPTQEKTEFVSEAERVDIDDQRSDGQELGKGGSPIREETESLNKVEGRLDSQELGRGGSPTEEETGSCPERTCRLHLPSPRRSKISPLKKYEDKKITKRRIVKKWSVLEEDTLRVGVHKFGEGEWKSILNCHKDIFEHRTAVDLKDKWRNMKRHG